jgi:lysophospholipase L1-like esterase
MSMSRKDMKSEPFKSLVVMGESTVEGGAWLTNIEGRWADVLARLINKCQDEPVEYHNKGIGANAISPRSPGYAASAKPSALERHRKDVIDLNPDLFVLCYGLNDMRAAMDVDEFSEDMQTIIGDVKDACDPLTVLTTVYYMTGWQSFPPFDKGSVELTLEYNQAIGLLAERNDGILSDAWDAEGGADWLINPDGVHANFVGNLIIGQRVFRDIAVNCSCLTNATFERNKDTQWVQNTTASRSAAGDPFTKTW